MAQKRRRLAQRRRACGYSQERFAEAVKVDRTTVTRWESGTAEPQPWHRRRIAKVLELSVQELDRLLTEAADAKDGGSSGARRLGTTPSEAPSQGQRPAGTALQHTGNHEELQQIIGDHQRGGRGGYGASPDTLPGRRHQPGSVEDDEVKRRNLLAAGGTVAAGTVLSAPTRVVHALEMVTSDGADAVATALDHLDELVCYYSEAVCRVPSPSLYDEMQGVRSYTGSLLAQPQGRLRSELTIAAGWLSNLLAVAASYLGDHTAALVWCSDAERRSHESGHPELGGWAMLTKAMIAYYQGRAGRSIALAASGQQVASEGSIVHAKLTAQEMRARAVVGDADGMEQAKRRATTAIAKLPPATAPSGAFSVQLAQDPPYTATSLLLVGKFEAAAAATGRVLDTAYHGPGNPGRRTSNYARALLVLGLAEARLGHAAEAAAAGKAALSTAKLVWPTMVLADKLHRVLTHRFDGVAEARDYLGLYANAASRLPHHTSVSEDRE